MLKENILVQKGTQVQTGSNSCFVPGIIEIMEEKNINQTLQQNPRSNRKYLIIHYEKSSVLFPDNKIRRSEHSY